MGEGRRKGAGNDETVHTIETYKSPGPSQEGDGGAQGRLDLTLIPRSVGSSEVAHWDQKCHMPASGVASALLLRPRRESVSFPRFWMLLGIYGFHHLPALV